MNASNLQESRVIARPFTQSGHLQPNSPVVDPSLSFSNANLRNTNYGYQNQPQNNFSPSQNNFVQGSGNYAQGNFAAPQNPSFNQNPGFYDPKFMGVNWETAQTQNSEVKIARSCWLGYHRNNYHPSMTQYRISYDEFNEMIDKIEEVSSSFKCIQTIYILMVLFAMLSIILFVIGLFIEPGESVTDPTAFDDLDNASTGLIVSGLLIFFIGGGVFALMIVTTLKRYEFNIRKMLQGVNQHIYYSRNIQWLTTAYCQHIEIKCLPVTAQQYYLMLQQTNQLKIGKEYLEIIKKGEKK